MGLQVNCNRTQKALENRNRCDPFDADAKNDKRLIELMSSETPTRLHQSVDGHVLRQKAIMMLAIIGPLLAR
jgi:hypothetical protein